MSQNTLKYHIYPNKTFIKQHIHFLKNKHYFNRILMLVLHAPYSIIIDT